MMEADFIGKVLITEWSKIAREKVASGTVDKIPVIPVYVDIGDLQRVNDIQVKDGKIILKTTSSQYQD